MADSAEDTVRRGEQKDNTEGGGEKQKQLASGFGDTLRFYRKPQVDENFM